MLQRLRKALIGAFLSLAAWQLKTIAAQENKRSSHLIYKRTPFSLAPNVLNSFHLRLIVLTSFILSQLTRIDTLYYSRIVHHPFRCSTLRRPTHCIKNAFPPFRDTDWHRPCQIVPGPVPKRPASSPRGRCVHPYQWWHRGQLPGPLRRSRLSPAKPW
jgi:hypothetical protein